MDWAWSNDFNWGQLTLVDLIVRLGVATIFGALIGWERERSEHAAGLRTHALVSVASALIMIVSTYGFPVPPDGSSGTLDPSRIAAQVVSGIGFLGAGVIIFRENTVRGLTTAATIWSVAGLGLAAGSGLYAAAFVAMGFMLLVQAGLKPVERRFFARHQRRHRIMLSLTPGGSALTSILSTVEDSGGSVRSLDMDLDDEDERELVEMTISIENGGSLYGMIEHLRAIPDVQRLTWRHGSSIVGKRARVMNRYSEE